MKTKKTKPLSDLGAAAAALGRLGGKAGTPAQNAARRANGHAPKRKKKPLDKQSAPL